MKFIGILFFCIVSFFSMQAHAVLIGSNGSSSNCYPFGCSDGSWGPTWSQFQDSSLFDDGTYTFDGLTLFQWFAGNVTTNAEWDFYLGYADSTTTEDTFNTSTIITNQVLVYSGGVTSGFYNRGDDIVFTFDRTFEYDTSLGNLVWSVGVTPNDDYSNNLRPTASFLSGDGISRAYRNGAGSTGGTLLVDYSVLSFQPANAVSAPSTLILLLGALMATVRLRKSYR